MPATQPAAEVQAVHRSPLHDLRKDSQPSIRLLCGLGVEGDAHCGATVQHVYAARKTPALPNLRQVHLIHAELHAELAQQGLDIAAGAMGENITTRGLDLLGLPRGARLHLGSEAVVEVTGLRDPCSLLNRLHPNLMAATLGRDAQGRVLRKAGVMAIVVQGGEVGPGDAIVVELPAGPHEALPVV